MKFKCVSLLRLSSIGLMSLLIASCATLNEAECISANWYDLGFDNALLGKKSSYVSEHTSACQKYAITPDFEQYREGWQQGVKKFCTAQSGWRYGIAGNYYRNTCDAQSEAEFFKGYQPAREIAQKKRDIDQLKRELRSIRERSYNDKLSKEEQARASHEQLDARLDLQLLELELFRLESNARKLNFY